MVSKPRYHVLCAAAERESGIAPCKGCTDRYPACAGHCQKYTEWKNAFVEAKKRVMRNNRVARKE